MKGYTQIQHGLVTAALLFCAATLFFGCTEEFEEGAQQEPDREASQEVEDPIGIEDMESPRILTIYRGETHVNEPLKLAEFFFGDSAYEEIPDNGEITLYRSEKIGEDTDFWMKELQYQASSGYLDYSWDHYHSILVENINGIEGNNEMRMTRTPSWHTVEEPGLYEWFDVTGSFPDGLQEDWGESDIQRTKDALREMGLEGAYELQSYCTYLGEAKEQLTEMFWSPCIDGIPVTAKPFNEANVMQPGYQIMNCMMQVDFASVTQKDALLRVCCCNGEFSKWTMLQTVLPVDAVSECAICTAEEAWEKVAAEYEGKTYLVQPVLQIAKLEYKLTEHEGDFYFVPVWTFAVAVHEGPEYANATSEDLGWLQYYQIDAVSGDFFLGWNDAFLSGTSK